MSVFRKKITVNIILISLFVCGACLWSNERHLTPLGPGPFGGQDISGDPLGRRKRPLTTQFGRQ